MNNVRPFPDWELAMLRRLLQSDFPGRDALLAQLEGAEVKKVGADNSVSIEVPTKYLPAVVVGRIPVEARALDISDGVAINVLLHVLQGRIAKLEIYKDDSSKVKNLPKPESFEVSIHRRDYNPFGG
jgi:hypothetical protein